MLSDIQKKYSDRVIFKDMPDLGKVIEKRICPVQDLYKLVRLKTFDTVSTNGLQCRFIDKNSKFQELVAEISKYNMEVKQSLKKQQVLVNGPHKQQIYNRLRDIIQEIIFTQERHQQQIFLDKTYSWYNETMRRPQHDGSSLSDQMILDKLRAIETDIKRHGIVQAQIIKDLKEKEQRSKSVQVQSQSDSSQVQVQSQNNANETVPTSKFVSKIGEEHSRRCESVDLQRQLMQIYPNNATSAEKHLSQVNVFRPHQACLSSPFKCVLPHISDNISNVTGDLTSLASLRQQLHIPLPVYQAQPYTGKHNLSMLSLNKFYKVKPSNDDFKLLRMQNRWYQNRVKDLRAKREDEEFAKFMRSWGEAKGRVQSEMGRKSEAFAVASKFALVQFRRGHQLHIDKQFEALKALQDEKEKEKEKKQHQGRKAVANANPNQKVEKEESSPNPNDKVRFDVLKEEERERMLLQEHADILQDGIFLKHTVGEERAAQCREALELRIKNDQDQQKEYTEVFGKYLRQKEEEEEALNPALKLKKKSAKESKEKQNSSDEEEEHSQNSENGEMDYSNFNLSIATTKASPSKDATATNQTTQVPPKAVKFLLALDGSIINNFKDHIDEVVSFIGDEQKQAKNMEMLNEQVLACNVSQILNNSQHINREMNTSNLNVTDNFNIHNQASSILATARKQPRSQSTLVVPHSVSSVKHFSQCNVSLQKKELRAIKLNQVRHQFGNGLKPGGLPPGDKMDFILTHRSQHSHVSGDEEWDNNKDENDIDNNKAKEQTQQSRLPVKRESAYSLHSADSKVSKNAGAKMSHDELQSNLTIAMLSRSMIDNRSYLSNLNNIPNANESSLTLTQQPQSQFQIQSSLSVNASADSTVFRGNRLLGEREMPLKSIAQHRTLQMQEIKKIQDKLSFYQMKVGGSRLNNSLTTPFDMSNLEKLKSLPLPGSQLVENLYETKQKKKKRDGSEKKKKKK